tara:strand:- start:3300 stop:3665 length:366 start_codon:yes stop_codon:yes gene_type:complete
MRKELKIAIVATTILIILYIVTAIIVVRFSIGSGDMIPGMIDCLTKMVAQDWGEHKCLCPTGPMLNNCEPTGKKYKKLPAECAECTFNIPPGINALQIVILILTIVTLLLWINVYTKTVKF